MAADSQTRAEEIAEIQAIAPLRTRRIGNRVVAFPDLRNYLPARAVSRDEARLRGWPMYCDFSPCGHGHISGRYTVNALCIDCARGRDGLAPIGIQLTPEVA